MKTRILVPQRYQVDKEVSAQIRKGHPWVFRSHMSSAASSFKDGQWLRLYDGGNQVLGYGIYDANGLIAIRVLKEGPNELSTEILKERIKKALDKRADLRKYSDAFRAIHGENDGFPGVVVDIYGSTAVLQTYADGVDGLGRFAVSFLTEVVSLKNVIWKFPKRRRGVEKEMRVLRGQCPEKIAFREGKLNLTVEIGPGQKSGTFLDLRGLRKWISLQKWNGKRVLNLFAYTGGLGLAAEIAGASEIWQVDASQGALDFARRHHALKPEKYRFICDDIFKWVDTLSPKLEFDVIIVDPPSMASEKSQVPGALRAYRTLYRKLIAHLKKNGILIACCCTSRISRKSFEMEVMRTLGEGFKLTRSIQSESDHPVRFPEADYLKLLVYQKSNN